MHSQPERFRGVLPGSVSGRFSKVLIQAAVVLLVVVGLFVLISGRNEQTVALADGTTVSLRQVGFGQEHRFVDGPWWVALGSRLPTNLARIFGIDVRTRRTPIDTLVLWVETRGKPGQLPFPQWIQVVDTQGLASAMVQGNFHSPSSNRLIAVFEVPSFPRHAPVLEVQLHAASRHIPNGSDHLGTFQFKNPAWAPLWAVPGGALPVTTEAFGEQFTLLELNTGLQATGTVAVMNRGVQWTELLFRIGTNEPARLSTNLAPSGDWSIRSVELWDDTGNRVQERNPEGRHFPLEKGAYLKRFDDGVVLVRGAVWPENLWRVRAEFRRNDTPTLEAEHQWTAVIPVPAPGEVRTLNQTGRVAGGGAIELLTIESRPPARPLLRLKVAGASSPADWKVLRVADQRGTNLVWRRQGSSGTGSRAEHRLELQTRPESTELHITFTVLPVAFVELQGRPAVLRTNIARWAPVPD